jgi:hypothetical protein
LSHEMAKLTCALIGSWEGLPPPRYLQFPAKRRARAGRAPGFQHPRDLPEVVTGDPGEYLIDTVVPEVYEGSEEVHSSVQQLPQYRAFESFTNCAKILCQDSVP